MPIPGGTSAQLFRDGPLTVLVAQEEGRWHLSISHVRRYPRWDEIADARYDLLPDALEMAMVLPPRANYVNLNPNVFHLWEMRDPEMPIERQCTGMRRSRCPEHPAGKR